MQDLSPPKNMVTGNATVVSSQMSEGYQKSTSPIPQHEHVVANIFGCPFMVALFEGRYDDLHGFYWDFRKLLSNSCNGLTIAAHDAHIALLHIQDEIAFFAEMVSETIAKILNRALNMVRDFISHVKLHIKYPAKNHTVPFSQNEINTFKALASSGKLSKKQVIALGCSVYEAAYINSEITQAAFIVDLGKFFNMKITETYARTAITDIRNDFKDGIPSYFAIFGERLTAKMEKLNYESDEAYDRKVRESRLSNKK